MSLSRSWALRSNKSRSPYQAPSSNGDYLTVVSHITPNTSDEEPLKSLNPFLGRLSRETRNSIYDYVLDFSQTLLARTKDETFPEKFIRWNHRREIWIQQKLDLPPPTIIDKNILALNKTIHTEALTALYRVDIISLTLQQCSQIFEDSDVFQHGLFSGDVAMVRQVLLRKSYSSYYYEWLPFRPSNTVNLDSIISNLPPMLPRLRSVDVCTDHLPHPTTALFNIGVELMNREQVREVRFDAVGSLVAETDFGLTVRVKHRRITREWQQEMTLPLLGDTLCHYYSRTALYCWMKRVLGADERGELLDDESRLYLDRYTSRITNEWKTFADDIPEAYSACSFDSHEFWTYAVGAYVHEDPFVSYESLGSSDTRETCEDDDAKRNERYDEDGDSDVATARIQIRGQ
jgi:hypothetical protein